MTGLLQSAAPPEPEEGADDQETYDGLASKMMMTVFDEKGSQAIKEYVTRMGVDPRIIGQLLVKLLLPLLQSYSAKYGKGLPPDMITQVFKEAVENMLELLDAQGLLEQVQSEGLADQVFKEGFTQLVEAMKQTPGIGEEQQQQQQPPQPSAEAGMGPGMEPPGGGGILSGGPMNG